MTSLGETSTTHPAPAARSNVGGVLVSHATYAGATDTIMDAAWVGRSLLVAATSVHGIATAALNPEFCAQLNSFDMLTPDGQPVRWALNLLHGARLSQRVYGPTLMLSLCREAARLGVGVYLYGGRIEVLERLVSQLRAQMPDLIIAGYYSPPFRPSTALEDAEDIQRIVDSDAGLTFVGLGCPRQERWAFAHRDRLSMPIVCVGAAFDFNAGAIPQAPTWMQDHGLEWLFRLSIEPRRLWRRYATCIPVFVSLVAWQYVRQQLLRIEPTRLR